MNFQTIYKQYTPNIWGLLGFTAASIYFPKLSPFLGIWYHSREIANNIEHTTSLSKQIEVQLPYKSETTVISTQGEINLVACISNAYGLIASIVELGAFICMSDVYTANSLRGIVSGKLKHRFNISKLFIETKILNLTSFISGLGSYAFTHKEYDFLDARTGISIDQYLISHPKTKIFGLYKPQSESTTDCTSTDETISGELVQQEEIEAIANLSS